jgi:hypothetical protein
VRRIAGSKEFDWVLTPKVAGELDLPPIHYSYFNPDSRRYEVATTSTAHVRVAPGALASTDTIKSESLLPLRTRYRGPARAPLHEQPVFWAFLALAPLPALSIRVRDRRRRTAARPPANRVARLERLARVSRTPDATEVRRAYAGALAERLGLEAESFTRPTALTRALRRRGVSTETATTAEQFLRELDEAAFAQHGVLLPRAAARAAELYRAVDAEALPKAQISLRTGGLIAIALVCAGVATARALDRAAAQQAFDVGVEAYNRHDFVSARESFIASVAAEPNAPDAWADLGTAAWAVADTGRSVAAWQRALRIEPLASDVRDRAELVHALPWSSSGYVPPLPPAWLFNLAALLWCGAWTRALVRARRGKRATTRGVAMLAVAAGVVAIVGFGLADRVSGRHVAVMRRTASLNVDPQLGSERGATAIIGEVVRITGRQGAWSRVSLDDGRDGWIENAALVALDPKEVAQAIVAN